MKLAETTRYSRLGLIGHQLPEQCQLGQIYQTCPLQCAVYGLRANSRPCWCSQHEALLASLGGGAWLASASGKPKIA
jgi:hypothetical protein